jgi:hypothetical protein
MEQTETTTTETAAQILPVDMEKARVLLETDQPQQIEPTPEPAPAKAKRAKGKATAVVRATAKKPEPKPEPSPEIAKAAEAPKLSAVGTVARAMDDALILGGEWEQLAKAIGKSVSMLKSNARWRTRTGSPWKLEEKDDTVKMVPAR